MYYSLAETREYVVQVDDELVVLHHLGTDIKSVSNIHVFLDNNWLLRSIILSQALSGIY